MIRALILDLDNTIYPVSSIADHLFKELFDAIDNADEGIDQNAKQEMTRRPFQWVADKYNFSPELIEKGLLLLRNLTYDRPMQAFDDYHYIKTRSEVKFLVTTGFSKLQWSKINQLGIKGDFKEIHVVDPDISSKTKKHIFTDILQKHHYQPDELLVIGDDPESEIKAGAELGIPTFLFDPANVYPTTSATYKAKKLNAIADIL